MNPRVSKHVRDNGNETLNVNIENWAIDWFVLCNYITMYGVKTKTKKF
jgi:hypothetical protein